MTLGELKVGDKVMVRRYNKGVKADVGEHSVSRVTQHSLMVGGRWYSKFSGYRAGDNSWFIETNASGLAPS